MVPDTDGMGGVMRDVESLSRTSRERLRAEIAAQTERFLKQGGRIEEVRTVLRQSRPVGPVWWNSRNGEPLANLG
jgi:hypothetical protein